MRRLDYPPARYHAPPERQVEEDAALEAGVEPPCRALVLAGPMPGDWCWWSQTWRYVHLLVGTYGGDLWSVRECGADGWINVVSVDTGLTPIYRRWST